MSASTSVLFGEELGLELGVEEVELVVGVVVFVDGGGVMDEEVEGAVVFVDGGGVTVEEIELGVELVVEIDVALLEGEDVGLVEFGAKVVAIKATVVPSTISGSSPSSSTCSHSSYADESGVLASTTAVCIV
jgi:hypothetical protein